MWWYNLEPWHLIAEIQYVILLYGSNYEWCTNLSSSQRKNMTAIVQDIADADISEYSESQLKTLVVRCPNESEVSG